MSANLLTEDSDLLLPYTYDMAVNGISCKVLRDTGATFDIVHPSFVKPEHFTGSCVGASGTRARHEVLACSEN